MKILLSTVSLFIVAIGICQNGPYNIQPLTNRVTNLEAKFTFRNFTVYDYDLRSSKPPTECYPIIVVNIGSDGTGRLSTFVKEKIVFPILDCIKDGNEFNLTLENLQGEKLAAILHCDEGGKVVKSFWINNKKDNTALVFY